MREIPGFPGYYATQEGEIWSNKRGKWCKLKPCDNGFGYYHVATSINNKRKHLFVHRGVCAAYHLNPLNHKEVNHINGNKSDNRPENLHWCNRSQNMRHADNKGLRNIRGEAQHLAKLTETDVLEIRAKCLSGHYTQRALAEEYGVSPTAICRVMNAQSWTHI